MEITNTCYLYEKGGKKNQEDYIWPPAGSHLSRSPRRGPGVFIVCDGVGGADNGEVASRVVAEYVGEKLSAAPAFELSTSTINDLLMEAQRSLVEHVRNYGLNADMATTFALLVLRESDAFIAWCGDSRVYHFRNGKLMYKTADHSLVNSLIRNGEITEEEALDHPQRNIILKAVRADNSPAEAETHIISDVRTGDCFLLCTDGLLENVADEQLASLTQRSAGAEDVVNALQQLCLNKTRDNYSMYLVQVEVESKKETMSAASPGRRSFSLLAMLLLLVAMIIAAGYYFGKDTSAASLQAPPGDDSATMGNANHAGDSAEDSRPYVEIVSITNEEDTNSTAQAKKKDSSANNE